MSKEWSVCAIFVYITYTIESILKEEEEEKVCLSFVQCTCEKFKLTTLHKSYDFTKHSIDSMS